MNLNLRISAAQEHVFLKTQGTKYRVFPKGRRLGLTLGACLCFTDYAARGIGPILWGDVTLGNTRRYFERYWRPFLQANKIPHHYRVQDNQLELLNTWVDFRGADRPENWEGFGYRVVFLNEAGIILRNEYLYENAVLPMLLDYRDSELIAAGTPKAARGLFRDLWDRSQAGDPLWVGKRYSSYDNPFLSREALAELEQAFTRPTARAQEIYGQFVDDAGAVFTIPTRYEPGELPHTNYREATGADFAYTSKAGDYTVFLTGREHNKILYVTGMYRAQAAAHEWSGILRSMPQPVHAFIGGQEQGILDLLRRDGVQVRSERAITDKLARAQPAAAAWAQGTIRIPSSAAWLPEFETEVLGFTGTKLDEHDDVVDALASLYFALGGGRRADPTELRKAIGWR